MSRLWRVVPVVAALMMLTACPDDPESPPAAVCGNGTLEGTETCDDGNVVAGDGCRADCTIEKCGDGIVDQGETCDDGNTTAGDGCRADCRGKEQCGDALVDPGEDCDNGASNGDTPDACRADCKNPACGDGVKDSNEGCDNGEANSDTTANACRTNCVLPTCGDGVKDSSETCDNGEANSDTEPGACRTNCALASCGDGVLDEGEECDDGANNSDSAPDACRTTCVSAFCGDGTVDQGETCDQGTANSDTVADACRTSCVPASCGDGVKDSNEACDSGANNSDTAADACRTSCALASCGDGVVDNGEVCDSGANNSDTAANACRTSCQPAHCGDGVVDTGEGCDAGAQNSDTAVDACRTSCQPAHCGDGVLDTAEVCDDGNTATGDGCSDTCTAEDGWVCDLTGCHEISCGDGILDNPEECDDGNDQIGDGCDANCELEPRGWTCTYPFELNTEGDQGDGSFQWSADSVVLGEQFDGTCATSSNNPDGVARFVAPATGTYAVGVTAEFNSVLWIWNGRCPGVGLVELGCTNAGSGNAPEKLTVDLTQGQEIFVVVDGYGSSSVNEGQFTLTVAPLLCGDGILAPGEECDDGNTVATDGCTDTCTIADGYACPTAGQACRQITCGDGFVDEGEECDDHNTDATDGCTETCAITDGYACPTAGQPCHEVRCGDGTIDAPEACDDGNTDPGDGCSTTCQIEHVGDDCALPVDLDVSGAAPWTFAGDTSTFTKKFNATCDSSGNNPETIVRFIAPADGTYSVTATGSFQIVLYAWDGACGTGSPSLGCTNSGTPRSLSLDLTANQAAYIVVDGYGNYSTNQGTFSLTVTPVRCGDGLLVTGEACDDGNANAGDGCSDTCAVEPGYVCPTAGQACRAFRCGDGTVDPGEGCDDGNQDDGDGCSASCALEIAAPGSAITVNGSLDSTDPKWSRPGETCTGSTAGVFHDTYTITNSTGADQTITVTASWGGDCYLHLYSPPFDPAAPLTNCIVGDDDFNGTNGSQIANRTIAAGASVVIVASTYGTTAKGAYSIEIATLRAQSCGDGFVDAPETCDDGNTADGDGCSAACAIEDGYVCNAPGQACHELRCGDGIIDAPETCDDGNGADGDGCSAACVLEDGFVCEVAGQDCRQIRCGDGIVDTGESCEDGNTADNDGCSSACVLEIAARGASVTVNGSLDETDPTWSRPGESCTGSTAGVFYDTYAIVNNSGVDETITVTASWGGDCYLHLYTSPFDPAAPQTNCIVGDDDFNGTSGSQIANRTIPAGATLVIVASTYSTTARGAYTLDIATIRPQQCGDSFIDAPESCDDGNTVDGDGCSATCTVEPGFICETAGQPCRGIVCGDGTIELNEGCEDGNTTGGDGCSADCIVEIPAPGTTQVLWGSLDTTDPKWNRPSSTCSTSSNYADRHFDAIPVVNNTTEPQELNVSAYWTKSGYLFRFPYPFDPATRSACVEGDYGRDAILDTFWLQPGEAVMLVISDQDANQAAGTWALELSTVRQPLCGDGFIDGPEVCDDLNTADDDGCSADCLTIAGGWTCGAAGEACVHTCGNGTLDPGEACDDANFVDGDGCAADCAAIEGGWVCETVGQGCTRLCGNGTLDPGEACDDGNFVADDGCSADCATVETGWACDTVGVDCTRICGNGTLDSGEACDDANFVGGDGCAADCSVVEAGYLCPTPGQACEVACGNGALDAGETCDDGNTVNGDGCSSLCEKEIAATGSSIQLTGALTSSDPTWARPGETCTGSNSGRYVDWFEIVNNTGNDQVLQITAAWPGDGYLHIYRAPFDRTAPLTNCIKGDDDYLTNGSQIDNQLIKVGPSETLVVVASTYAASTSFASYTITVLTKTPVCGDGKVTGGEVCDDGNTVDTDGCSCSAVAEGYVCDTPGQACTAITGTLVINEVDYDQPSTDTAEFMELYNRTGSDVPLAGLAVVLVNGGASGGAAEYPSNGRIALDSAGTLPAGGYLVIGPAGMTVPQGVLFVALPVASNAIQNGAPDAVALIDTVNGTVLDSLSYEGGIESATIAGFTDPVSLVDGTAATAIDTGDGSLCRKNSNGRDTHNDLLDWSLCATPTPGTANQ